jgi:hypothetical protein
VRGPVLAFAADGARDPGGRAIENLPHARRCCRHIDVAHANATGERIDDRIHHRRRRAHCARFAGALDAERIGVGTLWVEKANDGTSPARGIE